MLPKWTLKVNNRMIYLFTLIGNSILLKSVEGTNPKYTWRTHERHPSIEKKNTNPPEWFIGSFFLSIFCYHEREREIATEVYIMVTKENHAAVNMTKTRTKTQYKWKGINPQWFLWKIQKIRSGNLLRVRLGLGF